MSVTKRGASLEKGTGGFPTGKMFTGFGDGTPPVLFPDGMFDMVGPVNAT